MSLPARITRFVLALAALAHSLEAQQSFWQRTNGPYGGTVHSILRLPNGKLLIGTSDGVYGSLDSGRHWFPDGLSGADVRSLSYVDKGELAALRGNEIFVSSDLGSTWTHRKTFAGGISTFVADGNGTVFAGADTSLYRSTDAGHTWAVVTGSPYAFATSVLFLGDGIVVAGFVERFDGGGALQRSTDNGATWQVSGPGALRAIIRDSGGKLFATRLGEIYRSTDRGLTWVATAETPLQRSDSVPFPGYVSLLAADSCSSIYLGTDRGVLYRSDNSGDRWYRTPVALSPIVSILFDGCTPTQLGTATNGTLCYDREQGAWMPRNLGLAAANIKSLMATRPGEMVAATGGTVVRSSDGGLSWLTAVDSIVPSPFGNAIQDAFGIEPIAYAGTHIVAGTTSGVFLRSAGDNTVWEITDEIYGAPAINFIVASKTGRLFAVTSQRDLFSSEDNGSSWVPRTEIAFDSNNWLAGIGVDDAGTGYVALATGVVFRSTGDIRTWEAGGPPVPVIPSPILHVAPWGTVFQFGRAGELAVSIDQGRTWLNRPGLAEPALIMTTGPRHDLFVVTSKAILRTLDDGQTWDSVAPAIPGYTITRMLVSESGLMYAGTDRGGVFVGRARVSSMEEGNREKPSPEVSRLKISPNPTTASISISLKVAIAGSVSLSLVTPLGEVAWALEEHVEAGVFERRWSLDGYPAGVYLLRLDQGSRVEQRLLVVSR